MSHNVRNRSVRYGITPEPIPDSGDPQPSFDLTKVSGPVKKEPECHLESPWQLNEALIRSDPAGCGYVPLIP